MNPEAWGRHPRPIVLIGIGLNAELCTSLSRQSVCEFRCWLTRRVESISDDARRDLASRRDGGARPMPRLGRRRCGGVAVPTAGWRPHVHGLFRLTLWGEGLRSKLGRHDGLLVEPRRHLVALLGRVLIARIGH